MPHVASGSPTARLLRAALDEQRLGVRTLARMIVEKDGGNVESWRSQIGRILKGQAPERPTAITMARALGKPDSYFLADATDPVEELEAEVVDLKWAVLALAEASLLLTQQVVVLGGAIPQEMLDALEQVATRMRT